MIELIGVPFDLCGRHHGSRLGPEALRLAGITEALRALGRDVCDRGDMGRPREATAPGGLRNFKPLMECVRELRARVAEAFSADAFPLVLGGEHTIALGGMVATLAQHPDAALLWIDAHADLNVPGTSLTGNLHGMPIAALWGLPSGLPEGDVRHEEWSELLDWVGPHRLKPEHTAWFALRDVDAGERPQVAAPDRSLSLTMHEIDRYGVVECVRRFDAWMRAHGSRHLWLSFDVDALDPFVAPGTGTGVRGGLSYREGQLAAELLCETLGAADCPYRLVGMDVVETNPIQDNQNMTAQVAVDWVAALFGDTVLGVRS